MGKQSTTLPAVNNKHMAASSWKKALVILNLKECLEFQKSNESDATI